MLNKNYQRKGVSHGTFEDTATLRCLTLVCDPPVPPTCDTLDVRCRGPHAAAPRRAAVRAAARPTAGLVRRTPVPAGPPSGRGWPDGRLPSNVVVLKALWNLAKYGKHCDLGVR